MTAKRFHSSTSRRAFFALGAAGLLLAAISFAALRSTGIPVLWVAAAGVVLLVVLAVFAKQRKAPIEYEVDTDVLVLRRGTAEETLPMEEILDVNLVDRFTARDYVMQHQTKESDNDGATENAIQTQYCAVPIGAGRLSALLAGMSELSIRDFRRSLVLLRIRDGGAYLLSPKHGASMVSALGKLLRENREQKGDREN